MNIVVKLHTSTVCYIVAIFLFCVYQCITVLTGNRIGAYGKLSAVAGHHSFFRAVGSWSLNCQRDGLGSGMGKW